MWLRHDLTISVMLILFVGISACGGGQATFVVSPPEAAAKKLSGSTPEPVSSPAVAFENLSGLRFRLGKLPSGASLREIAPEVLKNLRALARDEEDDSRLESAIHLFSGGEWNQVARALAESAHPESVMDLLRIHDRLDLSITFAQSLTETLIRGDQAFLEKAVSRFGIKGALELVSRISESQVQHLKPEEAKLLVSRMALIFDLSRFGADAYDRWVGALDALVKLRTLERKLEPRLDVSESLSWVEQIHRRIERDFLTYDTDSARVFLKGLPDRSLDIAWLKLRVFGKDQALQGGMAISDVTPLGRVDRILKQRLKTRLATNAAPELEAYCKLLRQEGVPSLHLDFHEASARFDELLVPGCHRIIRGDDSEISLPLLSISRPHVEMPFDSVVIASDLDLRIDSGYFDGSFFDLSSRRKWPVLADNQPANPPSADALAFPIVAGLTIRQHSILRSGIYFLMAHYVYREASGGPDFSGVLHPQPGYRGGHLTVSSKNKASSPPVLVSQGGIGQMAPKGRAGGKSDDSSFNPQALRLYLSRYKLEHPELFEPEMQPVVLESPNVGMVKAILASAEREDHEIKVIIPEGYLKNLDFDQHNQLNAQGLKLESFCKGESLPELGQCFSQLLAPRFMSSLMGEVNRHQRMDQTGEILPFLKLQHTHQLDTFQSPSGTSGPDVAVGGPGEPGQLEFETDHD
jgi:hypothetical protein